MTTTGILNTVLGGVWAVTVVGSSLACSPGIGGARTSTRSDDSRSSGLDAGGRRPSSVPPARAPVAAAAVRWTTGADSLPQTSEGATSACFSDVGCPRVPARIASCPPNLHAKEFGEVARNLDAHVGEQLIVQGYLRIRNEIPELLARCAGCCQSSVPMFLAADAGSAAGLLLRDAARPAAFSCRADVSQACCGLDVTSHAGGAGHHVVATGMVVRERHAGSPPAYFLDDPGFCSLDQPDRIDTPPVSFDQDGCTAAGVHRTMLAAFEYAGALCGCNLREVTCRKVDADACFLRGSWFQSGATVHSRASCMDLRCAGAEWSWAGGPCSERPTVVYFADGSAVLDTGARSLLEATATWMLEGSRRFTVEGHGASTEASHAASLARQRAERVASALREVGVSANRLIVRAAGRGKLEDTDSVGRVEIAVLGASH